MLGCDNAKLPSGGNGLYKRQGQAVLRVAGYRPCHNADEVIAAIDMTLSRI